MIEIPLTQGQVTYVDDVDSDLAELKWYAQFDPTYADGGRYKAARDVKNKVKRELVYMHRLILERVKGRDLDRFEYVDHQDLNPLNNQRDNLRLATPRQNSANRSRRSDNTSGYKGVNFRKDNNLWVAAVVKNGKRTHLGYFPDPISAAKAYDAEVRKLYGEFALTNFPDEE